MPVTARRSGGAGGRETCPRSRARASSAGGRDRPTAPAAPTAAAWLPPERTISPGVRPASSSRAYPMPRPERKTVPACLAQSSRAFCCSATATEPAGASWSMTTQVLSGAAGVTAVICATASGDRPSVTRARSHATVPPARRRSSLEVMTALLTVPACPAWPVRRRTSAAPARSPPCGGPRTGGASRSPPAPSPPRREG